jgi:opacity protein-like surface antigen
MKKILLALSVVCFLVSLAAAAPPQHVDTKVFLSEKTPTTPAPPDPNAALWDLKFGGGYGYLTYRVWGPEFSFKIEAKKLVRNTPYALIYYPDPWPGTNLIILAEGTSNGGGNLLLKGKVKTGNLPASFGADANFPGAKIWLVPNPADYINPPSQGSNVSTGFFAWPTDGAGILFETALINYYETK